MKKLLVVLLVLIFATPAMAAEWDFYGSARAGFWYTQFDEDASEATEDANGVDPESDTDLNYFIQGNSRIGAKVKTSDIIGGRFEYGATPNLRLLYGTVKLGGATLLGGVDYTPVDTLYSNQVANTDGGLNNEGMIYEGRLGQAKLQMGGFQVALVVPTVQGISGVTDVDANTDVMLPKVELAYDLNMDTMSVGGYFGFQTYDRYMAGESDSVTSYVLGARGKFNFGPAYVNFCVAFAQNGADYGLSLANKYAAAQDTSGADVEDATSIMGALVFGAKLGASLGIEAGVGYLSNSVDVGGEENTGDAMTYYVQLPITVAQGFFVVPEVSIFDLGENDNGATTTENGQRVDFGAKIQINF